MLKQRITRVIIALALFAAVAGSSGIVADSLGSQVIPHASACEASGSSGGGC